MSPMLRTYCNALRQNLKEKIYVYIKVDMMLELVGGITGTRLKLKLFSIRAVLKRL
jgi:hypothetical protein